MIHRMAVLSMLLATAGATSVVPPAARAAAHEKKLAAYKVIVVEAFTIDKSATAQDAARGLASELHERAVEKLQAKALFDAVVDAAPVRSNEPSTPNGPVDLRVRAAPPPIGTAAAQTPDNRPRSDRRLILHCAVLSFSKGNRAVRYLGGFGAGESKLKVRFALTDAKTGAKVMDWEQTGTFKGTFTPFGGSANQAMASAANGVVKGLIKQIEKNR
jgi:hypothetical protein